MWKEFKEFIARGNVMDLAVAVILGAAFAAVVSSFVGDVLTPAVLAPAMEAAGVSELSKLTWNGIAYGSFLASVLSFLVIAAVLFLVVRGYNRFMGRFREPGVEPVPRSPEQAVLEEIRDLLARRTAEQAR